MSELIDALDCALEFAKQRCQEMRCAEDVIAFEKVQELVSTPDALAWALLEEMAERVEVQDSGFCHLDDDDPDDGWQSVRYAIPPIEVELDVFGNAGCDECEPLTVCVPELELSKPARVRNLILCLARAIKEQEGRVKP